MFSLPDISQHAASQVLKKTFRVAYRGIIHHIISYVRVVDTVSGLFCTPSEDHLLGTIIPRRELVEQLDSKTFSIIGALPSSAAYGQTGLTASSVQGNLRGSRNGRLFLLFPFYLSLPWQTQRLLL